MIHQLFEQLGIRPDLILVNIVSFLLLLWLLKKLLFGPVTKLLDARTQEIRSDYESAENEKARMEQLRAEYEAKLADVAEEARAKIAAAVHEGQEMKQQIIAEARGKAEDILRRGAEELAREHDKAISQLRSEVVELATEVAGKAVARALDDEAHRRLIREFIEGIGADK